MLNSQTVLGLVLLWILSAFTSAPELMVRARSLESPKVVFLGQTDSSSYRQLELVSRHLGIGLLLNPESVRDTIQGWSTPVLVIESSMICDLSTKDIAQLTETDSGLITIMLLGLAPETAQNCLTRWVHGRPQIRPIEASVRGYTFADSHLARELAGRRLPVFAGSGHLAYGLKLQSVANFESLIETWPTQGSSPSTILGRFAFDGRTIFLVPRTTHTSQSEWEYCAPKQSDYCHERFIEIAPLLMVLQDAFGARCWARPVDLANLTIDDPWLREPYGHLSYYGLLDSMRRVDFHTTIGFVPWNYERSKEEVVRLLAANPNRFSIALHGNNHDHVEFGDYDLLLDTADSMAILMQHEENIRTALSRMEHFSSLTGLPYEKVMIFPHRIAPLPTLQLLMKYGFLATFNGSNVAAGSARPEDPVELLRSSTNSFGGLPSYHRFSGGLKFDPKDKILIDLFLGNPVIFSTHHDYFATGSAAFEPLARFINSAQPNLKWTSLGEIARHNYFARQVGNSIYEVQSFSREIRLHNTSSTEVLYKVHNNEMEPSKVVAVRLDDRVIPWSEERGMVSIAVRLGPGTSRLLKIEFLTPSIREIDPGKTDFRIWLIRNLSDLRDIWISTSNVGRYFVGAFYATGAYRLEISGLIAVAVVLTVAALFLSLWAWYKLRSY